MTDARAGAQYRGVRVLAFDPGYGRTGWGVVESGREASRLVGVAYGVLETLPGGIMADRMADLYQQATDVIAKFGPDHVIMESLFFTKNPTTAAGVYQAQGVLLAAVGVSGRPILEIGPGTIKQVIAGSGRAKKAEVTRMVERLLGFREPIRPDDAADALAGAVAGIYHARSENLIARALHAGNAPAREGQAAPNPMAEAQAAAKAASPSGLRRSRGAARSQRSEVSEKPGGLPE